MRAGHLTRNALRRPPTGKLLGSLPVSCTELAQELGLKTLLEERDLLSSERASQLLTLTESLPGSEREQYEALASAAITAIIRRKQGALAESGEAGGAGAPSAWNLPGPGLFHQPTRRQQLAREAVEDMGRRLQQTLVSFGAHAEVRDFHVGPRVLRFDVLPTGVPLTTKDGEVVRERGAVVYKRPTKAADIVRLKADLQAALQARTIDIQNPVPGTPYVGIAVPNPQPETVLLAEVLESADYLAACARSRLVMALGRDLSGRARWVDLARAPHLLIAGTTGGGKSIGLRVMIASLLARNTPEELRFLMIDPKMVELAAFRGIPHLLYPPITDVAEAAQALEQLKTEMRSRYQLFTRVGARDLASYRKARAGRLSQGDRSLPNLPAVVAVIDELASLMEQVGEAVEPLISELAALARATGIHLVIATQRPSVDVITGTIKANIPTRIAFMVSSSTDSRVILDMGGAEALLGQGDLLLFSPEAQGLERIQGAFVDDDEVEGLVAFWIDKAGLSSVATLDTRGMAQAALPFGEEAASRDVPAPGEPDDAPDEEDELEADIARALPIILEAGKASTSFLQLKMRIGYNRAARIIEALEERGVIGKQQSGGKPREVLIAAADDAAALAPSGQPLSS